MGYVLSTMKFMNPFSCFDKQVQCILFALCNATGTTLLKGDRKFYKKNSERYEILIVYDSSQR